MTDLALQALRLAFTIFTQTNVLLPSLLAGLLSYQAPLNAQQRVLLQCFSLLLLGMFLATLATLNFSLAILIGLLAAPLSFAGQPFSTTCPEDSVSGRSPRKIAMTVVLQLLSPPVVLVAACRAWNVVVEDVLIEAAFGWKVHGLWTQVIVWCVWWPAWIVGGVVCSPFL